MTIQSYYHHRDFDINEFIMRFNSLEGSLGLSLLSFSFHPKKCVLIVLFPRQIHTSLKILLCLSIDFSTLTKHLLPQKIVEEILLEFLKRWQDVIIF